MPCTGICIDGPRMKIALFASAFHPHVGGVEEVVRQIAHTARLHGDKPIVVTNRWPRNLSPADTYQEIPVFRAALRAPEQSLKSHLTYHLTHRTIQREIVTLLREWDADIIHVHCVSANAWYAMRAGRKLGVPVVVTSHSERTMDATRIFERSPFMNKVLRESLSSVDYVTACSRDTLDDLRHFMNGRMCPRNRVIYNGIDLTEFAHQRPYSHPRRYILAMGRFVRPKGFDILLTAFAQSKVAETHDLILGGDGPEEAALNDSIRRLKLEAVVHLPGRLDRERALTLMQNSSFFLHPPGMKVIRWFAWKRWGLRRPSSPPPSEVCRNR